MVNRDTIITGLIVIIVGTVVDFLINREVGDMVKYFIIGVVLSIVLEHIKTFNVVKDNVIVRDVEDNEHEVEDHESEHESEVQDHESEHKFVQESEKNKCITVSLEN